MIRVMERINTPLPRGLSLGDVVEAGGWPALVIGIYRPPDAFGPLPVIEGLIAPRPGVMIEVLINNG